MDRTRGARSRRAIAAAVSVGSAAAVVAGLLVVPGHASGSTADVPQPAASVRPPVTVTPDGPYRNVVVVMVDDMSTAMLDANPRLAAMAASGVRFSDYVVTDSLCCSSRASFLTGRYVHNHGVLSNMPRQRGGWSEFAKVGWDDDNLGLWLQRAGIRTGYVGKYLNGYPTAAEPTRVPKGWDDWFLPDGRAYSQYGYGVNDSGVLREYGYAPEDHGIDVLAEQASEFIATSGDAPFFLTVAPFSPHLPATPPLRYESAYADATYPVKASRNLQHPGEPRWLRRLPTRTYSLRLRNDEVWRDQLRSGDAIADLVDRVRGTLDVIGHLDDTLLVFVSDNGFHFDEHRLPMGKRTPYDEDVVVPFVLMSPRLPPSTVAAPASGVDLVPTVLDALGVPGPQYLDGRSALGPALGQPTPRTVTYTEHLVAEYTRGDPDLDAGDIVSVAFRSVRTPDWVYVEYDSGEVHLFAADDVDQMTNLAPVAPADLLDALHQELVEHAYCQGDSCLDADVEAVLPAVTPVALEDALIARDLAQGARGTRGRDPAEKTLPRDLRPRATARR